LFASVVVAEDSAGAPGYAYARVRLLPGGKLEWRYVDLQRLPETPTPAKLRALLAARAGDEALLVAPGEGARLRRVER